VRGKRGRGGDEGATNANVNVNMTCKEEGRKREGREGKEGGREKGTQL
jgi:hypothetical protein